MITVSVSQLLSAIEDAEVFQFPSISAGADYLYNSLYRRLSQGEEARLSEIDYNAFGLDDIDTVRELYSDVLDSNESRAERLASTLRGLPPVVTATAFV